jgi:hypothetical protein
MVELLLVALIILHRISLAVTTQFDFTVSPLETSGFIFLCWVPVSAAMGEPPPPLF